MGFKRMDNSLGFADLALATSLKHNRSLILIARNRGIEQSTSAIVRFRDDFIKQMFDCPHLVSTALHQMETIRFLGKQIEAIEAEVETYGRTGQCL